MKDGGLLLPARERERAGGGFHEPIKENGVASRAADCRPFPKEREKRADFYDENDHTPPLSAEREGGRGNRFHRDRGGGDERSTKEKYITLTGRDTSLPPPSRSLGRLVAGEGREGGRGRTP